MNRIYKAFKVFISIVLVIVVILAITTIAVKIKGKAVEDKISEFKNRSEYVGTYTITNEEKSQTNAYYKITKEYDYEINDDRRLYNKSFTEDNTKIFTDIFVGDIGDIYLSTSNPFGLIYTEWMSKQIYIGHAGIVSNDSASKIYESIGNDIENNGVHEFDNDWFFNSKSNIILIRNKNTINKKEIQNWLIDKENSKYNYLYFIKAKNRYYCTDLTTRCYEESNELINTKNNIMVSGASIINYDDNYIIYYREKSNEENVDYNIYYLE